MAIAVRYFINGTFDSNLGAAVCGYSETLGFAADRNGNQNVWLHNVLSLQNDDSYLFLGGGYHLTPGDHSSLVRARSAFNLKYDLNNAYTPASPTLGTGEAEPTNVELPLAPHTWTVTFRWRVVGGTPDGRSEDDYAFNILVDTLAGTSTNVRKTYAEASPVFRTDTVSIRNPGNAGYTSPQFGHVLATFASEALRDTVAEPPEGPNYLPVQMAWITVTGPNTATAIPRGRPGYRRGHFI